MPLGPPAAVFTMDNAGRITAWSAQAAELFARTADDTLGHTWETLFDTDALSRLENVLVTARGGQICTEVLHVKVGDGRLLHLGVTCFPLVGSSGVTTLLCKVTDIEVGRRTESQMAFMDELMRQSPIGLVMIDENLRYVLVNDALAAINRIPAQDHIGRRVGEIVMTRDDGAYEQRMLETLRTGEPLLGMHVSGRTTGHWDEDREWSVSLFRLTGRENQILGLGGVVVDVTDQQSALLAASAARRRLALVNEASTRMGRTLELAQIAQELSAVAVPDFADLTLVKVREDLNGDFAPEIRRTPVPLRRLAGQDQMMNSGVSDEIFRKFSTVTVHPGSLLHESMLSREARFLRTIDDEAIAVLAHSDAHAELIRRSRLGTLIVAPFIARDRVLGVAMFGRSSDRAPMTDEDFKTALELTARTATCLDNALVYSNERRIAVALQQSMLPQDTVIPQLPGLEVAHFYRPSSRAAQVGGDWFDVVTLPNHRVAFMVGDVMGHDIQAAANMGQLRTAMRTLAQLDLEPVDLLTHLDETVQQGTTMQYATCIYAVCNLVTRDCSIVCAGHPPPLLRHGDGTTEVLDVSPGIPLGVASGDPEFAVTELVLPADSTLVLYTDGLVERRGQDIDTGIENLRTVLTQPASSARELCERVTAEMGRSLAEDDLAMLMARLPSGADRAVARWTLTPDPESVSQARSLTRRTLREWDLDLCEDTAVLLVSELVTNAIRYSDGDIELRLAKGGVLVCEVADGSVHTPRRRRSNPEAEGGRGLTIVNEYAQDWGTRPLASGKVVWFELALPAQEAPPAP